MRCKPSKSVKSVSVCISGHGAGGAPRQAPAELLPPKLLVLAIPAGRNGSPLLPAACLTPKRVTRCGRAAAAKRPRSGRKTPEFPDLLLKLEKRAGAGARFSTFKSKTCCKVAEKVRNVFRTTSRTCGVSIGPKLAELRPKNRQKQPQTRLFLACFQHNPFISPQKMIQVHPPPLSPPRDT